MTNKLRNVAIIAHVDHGKTTLVDALLRQSKTDLGKEENQKDLIMDSNDLERERGITIFSKNASVRIGDVKINIIDTPGHADFGGEVERVLSMADGCLLLVDAKEGPMPQTRFVLKKALELGHKVIVVVNKIDKPDARSSHVVDKTFDLFVELGADDQAADFPVIYASAKNGLAGLEPDLDSMTDITPIFDAILEHVAAPDGDATKPLQMLVTSIMGDSFKGRIAIGKIHNGVIKAGQEVMHINRAGEQKKFRLVSLMGFEGLGRADIKEAEAGDIIAVSGIAEATVGETLADPDNPVALPILAIDEPTVVMRFMINDSPFAGKEGQFTTSRQIRERLFRELETDTALRVSDSEEGGWDVAGRGELHLAILIERMRREGYEFQVSRPQVINKKIDGKNCTPYEKVFIEVPEVHQGAVMQTLGLRGAKMQDMRLENTNAFLEFLVPTRGLFGYRNEFLTETKGLGIMNTIFQGYLPDPGNWRERENGSLIASESGQTLAYGLMNVQDRGALFFGPGVNVYKGQVVGRHIRSEDLPVNICKAKQLSNTRSKGSGVSEHQNAPQEMNLEDSLEYIGDDELVEVTPENIRIRKKILDPDEARRKARGINS